ncbi:LCP family protein [Deinococcus deserti]|uniref:Putative cell envelope-related transcriptional attenuator n=1 Tax=Deinococcus deserti (strain DSM 17065 / CIP 109153 / LMG 22923 / VCD115) TaxID=546414 RepID=C1D1J1_DEIDV|nr:LCP family protein [Deinococcus deserti]ACO45715.1 putative cell envelope-related transcriptional attenuator, precursor [Deinococcus deserti VCD115]
MLRVVVLAALAGLVALSAPAAPALMKYGALPRKAEGPVTLLLAGVAPEYDENAPVWPYPVKPEDYKGNTDTLVLAQLRPDGTVNLLSIPRDTWLNVPGWGWGKINGANPHGGPEMVMNAVQSLTGVKPDAYVFLSLYAVRALTDAAGGVTLDVQQRMKYDDNAGKLHVDLQPGRQTLNGVQAEGYLRFRNDNLGDIGRVGRQQQFMTAMGNQVKNPLNWWRLPMIAGALDRTTKTNISREQFGALLGGALSGLKVQTHTVPGNFGRSGRLSIWETDRAALNALIAKHFRDPNDPRSLGIAVVNIDAPAGSAARLKTKLESLGYRNVWIASEPRGPAPTTITGSAAPRLLQDVGHGTVTSAAGVSGADVTVRLGTDTPAN